MGIFKNLFKNKYDKLSREDIVDAIVKLENESNSLEHNMADAQRKIDDLLEKGKNEKSREMKLFYAKKINAIKEERTRNSQRALYLLYNISLMEKLKTAIDDNSFFANTTKISFNNLLGDQKGLAKFLNKALNTRVTAENILTSADETFNSIAAGYEPNEGIYGTHGTDDELLAMFESDSMIDDDTFADVAKKSNTAEENKRG